MTQSPQSVVATRRDLSQRIERLLDLHRADPVQGLTGYQVDKILDAMNHLQGGHFSDSEWMVLNAERCDLFEPRNYMRRGGPIDVATLTARLKLVLANEG
jgi:hypothetical protein